MNGRDKRRRRHARNRLNASRTTWVACPNCGRTRPRTATHYGEPWGWVCHALVRADRDAMRFAETIDKVTRSLDRSLESDLDQAYLETALRGRRRITLLTEPPANLAAPTVEELRRGLRLS